MLSKVSVVIPLYKVEKYLKRCLDTIINQSYTNLEIILVNDGSPDDCGTIAENYAKNDHRIKVIHQKNGGLSDARNTGMKHATGEFTLFVDSDDWLDICMIEQLVNASIVYKADVVQTAFYYAYDEYWLFDNRFHQKDEPPIILDNMTLMTELVKNDKVKNFAWGKLYKTNLIKDIPFKKGVLFEDVFWAHQVMYRVQKYVILNQPLCYYFQRNDSIISTYSSKNLDIISGLIERQCFIEKFYQNLTLESYRTLLNTILIHYNLLLIKRKSDKGGLHKKALKQYVRKNYSNFKKATEKDASLNKQLLLFSIHPYVNLAFLALKKALRKLGIGLTINSLEKIEIGATLNEQNKF
jgi:glycosyltransferase involved in cell wall biosynthesis